MQIDRKNALRLWEAAFGKSVEATDFAGRKINKSAYDQKSSKFGWVVSLVVPKAHGGKENDVNTVCVHVLTADEKGDEYPVFVANEIKFRVTGLNEAGEGYMIEQAVDDETIAEQEAKNAAAIEKWDALFGAEYEKAVDFCGRMIHKSEFCTDSEYAWKVAPYVDTKPMDNKNAYIANVKSIEEALGKTAFKANGKSFTLNKDNGAYYFKALEIKPPKKQFDIKDPYDFISRVNSVKEKNDSTSALMLDFLIIRAVTKPGCTSAMATTVADSVSAILSESIGQWISLEVSEMQDQNGARYMFLTYRFDSPQPADFERVFMGAKLLNTYSPMLLAMLGIDELKVYDYACFVDPSHKNYPVSALVGYYPQLRALCDSIYGSAYGFYEGECTTTLYVSHFIVYNVPSLAEMYPEGATQYLTEAEMVEHNRPVDEVSDAIRRMFSGEPEPSAEPESAPASTEPEIEEEPASEPVAVEPENFEAKPDDTEQATVEVEAEAEVEVEAVVESEPEEAPTVQPVIEETPVVEEIADSSEVAAESENKTVLADEPADEVIEEAAVVEEAAAEEDEQSAPSQAQIMANALASALARNDVQQTAVKAPAFPDLTAAVAEEPDENEEADEDAEGDDIVTLDLDSIL